MKILLIGTREAALDTDKYYGHYADFFLESLRGIDDDDATVATTLIDNLFVTVGDGSFVVADTKSGRDLKEFDAVFIRGVGLKNYADVVKAVSMYAHLHNVPITNDYSDVKDTSKLSQAAMFFTAGLPSAQCVYASGSVLEGKHELPFSFPCIMKASFGAHGNDNHVVHSLEEARGIAAARPGISFVLQRFVPNDGDFRILVAGDRELVIHRKASGDTHLNNTSQGGTGQLVEASSLPAEIIEQSHKIAELMHMDLAGVDALADKNTGEFYFLEVNSQPQLMSGVYIDEKVRLMGYFLESLTARADTASHS
jgi:glutathione synthase/RimK-type ligase-like ATP-grasp enzyme